MPIIALVGYTNVTCPYYTGWEIGLHELCYGQDRSLKQGSSLPDPEDNITVH
jgi:hypothetical protein